MGRLSGFTSKEVIKRLKRLGFFLARHKGDHDVYLHPDRPGVAAVPRHAGDIKEWTLKGMLKKAGIEEQDFLEAS